MAFLPSFFVYFTANIEAPPPMFRKPPTKTALKRRN